MFVWNTVLSLWRQIPNRLSVFSVFNRRYSVFFGIPNTDVGIGIGISKYRISVPYFGIGPIPTQDYQMRCMSTLRSVVRLSSVPLFIPWSYLENCETLYIGTAYSVAEFRSSSRPSRDTF